MLFGSRFTLFGLRRKTSILLLVYANDYYATAAPSFCQLVHHIQSRSYSPSHVSLRQCLCFTIAKIIPTISVSIIKNTLMSSWRQTAFIMGVDRSYGCRTNGVIIRYKRRACHCFYYHQHQRTKPHLRKAYQNEFEKSSDSCLIFLQKDPSLLKHIALRE